MRTLFLLLVLLPGSALCAREDPYEVIRSLPPIDATEFSEPAFSPAQPISYLGETQNTVLSPAESFVDAPYEEPIRYGVTDHKEGFFQQFSLRGTWLNQPNDADLGVTEVELFGVFAVPAPSRESPLLITPGFNRRFLDGPIAPDLPPRLYDAYLQFMWLPWLNDQWGAVLAVSPGVYSDFEKTTGDAIRILGRALLRYRWSDSTELMAGVLYLDRDDVALLPAGGIIWAPNPDIRYEILFPRPKLAHRLSFDGEQEDWVYLGGEFGGDTWEVQRTTGVNDRLTLYDLRLTLGWQRKWDRGKSVHLEVGYVFDRTLEYLSTPGELQLEDTFLLRAGFTR